MRKAATAFAFTIAIASLAACSPGESAESTTSSTSSSSTTSSTVASTSSTTSSTSTSTTSTTIAATTTTAAGVEGDFADEPLIVVDFGALGWWDGSGWLDAESEGALPVVGGEDYQVVLLNDLAMTSGGPQTTVCEPLDLIGVVLEDISGLGEFPGPYGVAISAGWALQPHLFESVTDDGTYAAFARTLLAERGLDVASPVVKQLFRTDLEGDGVNEVLVVAEEVSPGFIMEPGDYSILFMRKVVDGEVQTAVLAATVALDEDDQFQGSHSVGTVADLNGDAKMEIVSNSAFFEGFAVGVWEYVNDDLGPLLVLERGCGS